MTVERWEEYYQYAHERGLEKINNLQGAACAFHSVIDGFIHATPDLIRPVLESDPALKRAALDGSRGEPLEEINTPSDFIHGLFYSLSRGAALQRMIRSEETYRWVLETFGPGELRLGGTSGNMARSLAPLGIPVTVYANPLTVELAELFGDYPNLSVIAEEGGGYCLKPPAQAANERGVFAIHWIFDYGADFEMEIDGTRIAPGRANRYIPSWNPCNNQFQMSETFAAGFLERIESYSHLLFSGFHILSERYPDGSTCEDVVRPVGEYLQQVRSAMSGLKIHLEMASIGSKRVRESVLQHVIPHVHSLGLNETELPLLLENFGEEKRAQQLREEPCIVDFLEAVSLAQEKTNLERIHFHNLGYYLCMEREPWRDSSSMRDALLFAAVMAAARAENGLFQSTEDIACGLKTPVGKAGFEQLQKLSERTGRPSLASEGIGEWEGKTIACVPTKIVSNPLFTVGLGDTISAGAFLTE